VGVLLFLSSAIFLFTSGNVLFALAPPLAVGLIYALWKIPVRHTLLGLLWVALTSVNPAERFAELRWTPPVFGQIGPALFDNLNNLTGIQPLRFSMMEVLFLGMGLLLFIRKLRQNPIDEVGQVATPRLLKTFLLINCLTIIFLEVYGIARGGDFRQSLWQTRQLLLMGPICLLYMAVLRGPADYRAIVWVILSAAMIRATMAIYFYMAICRPLGYAPAHATTHSDTVLFIGALVILIANLVTYPSRRAKWLLALMGPYIFYAVIVNNRRLAYVSFFACILVIIVMMPRNKAKVAIMRLGLIIAPFIPVYVTLGQTSNAAIFRPVQGLLSVGSTQDSSSGTRDIENFNLIITLKAGPLIGSGFGHEYIEMIKADDITEFFAQYRYIAHNSVLWLWSIGGLLGFTGFWALLLVTVFFAARGLRVAQRPDDRAAGLCCLCSVVLYMNQAWGDMGVQAWPSVLIVCLGITVSGKLAVATGSWPARAPAPAQPQPLATLPAKVELA
jgi:hypothetical protein